MSKNPIGGNDGGEDGGRWNGLCSDAGALACGHAAADVAIAFAAQQQVMATGAGDQAAAWHGAVSGRGAAKLPQAGLSACDRR